jgi:hypothetical protein
MMSPYTEGYYAAKAGESYFSNPYLPDTKEWIEWSTGFKDGQDYR